MGGVNVRVESNSASVPSKNTEPIAVIGMACRFPGANNIVELWQLLAEGRNAITEGVPGSGIGRIGQMYQSADVPDACRFGGFIDAVDQFDADFFRIAPLEAQLLDPQQRLMLETSWCALEDAGIDAEQLKGSRTGIYAGISSADYRYLVQNSRRYDNPAAGLYEAIGISANAAIGRVSFVLGLRGAAMGVDTACSSSLVATHQAVRSLQWGETDLALTGGVNFIAHGAGLEARARAGMLSPDGQCKAYDASANGYVRGEGCGILVLKRLREAEADGDRIWGVLRGSAVNHGGAGAGLTVPVEAAQTAVAEEALSRAGIAPAQVDYVEAHGTGTPVGDPIELRAMARIYGKGHTAEQPLLIGSVKSNIGHTEAAAGVAGLIKVLLSMQSGTIPPHLHFRNPTTAVDWRQLPVQVTATETAWPCAATREPIAGVNSLGWSGTNAHVIVTGYRTKKAKVESPPHELVSSKPITIAVSSPVPDQTTAERSTRLLPLAGKTRSALRDLASSYLALIEARSVAQLADMVWTASIGRCHFAHRAAVVFRDSASLQEGLQAIVNDQDEQEPSVTTKIAFAFTGQGGQWLGMGKSLYQHEPVVRAVLDRCEAVMLKERNISLLDVMFGNADAEGDLYTAAWAQPATYALECALTAMWSSLGVVPAVVIGHSLGEYAAAQAAGALALEDGLRFLCQRGALLDAVPEKGTMVAVMTTAEKVTAAVQAHSADGKDLSVAVDNGVHQVVSGTTQAVEALTAQLEAEGIEVRRLRNNAFHCELVEPALDGIEAAYSKVNAAAPSLPLISGVTGKAFPPDVKLDGSYWRQHTRQPVQFGTGINTLAEMGVDLVIEVGPHAVLSPLIALAWPTHANPPRVLTSLLRPSDERPAAICDAAFITAVAQAYEAGVTLNFRGMFASETRRRVALPTYPFQRRRFWVETRKRTEREGHPLLGVSHELPRGDLVFANEISATDPEWLTHHRVFGQVVMPCAGYAALAVAALPPAEGSSVVLEDLQLHSPLLLPEREAQEEGSCKLQLVLDAADRQAARHFEVHSKGEHETAWKLHAEGKLRYGMAAPEIPPLDMETLQADKQPLDIPTFYRGRAESGIEFGALFRTLVSAWSKAGEAVGEVALPAVKDASGMVVHPILLDGLFHLLSAAREQLSTKATYMPFGWERLWIKGKLPERIIGHACIREANEHRNANNLPETIVGDIWLYALDGTPCGSLTGFTVKRAERTALLAAQRGVQDLLYEVVWREHDLTEGMLAANFLTHPSQVVPQLESSATYLRNEGVEVAARASFLRAAEQLTCAYVLAALEKLGWQRQVGTTTTAKALQTQLGIIPEHRRLVVRLVTLLSEAGVLTSLSDGQYRVAIGKDNNLPDTWPHDVEAYAADVEKQHRHAVHELGLLRSCGKALAEVLRGEVDPLTLLFPSRGASAEHVYHSPFAQAINRMLSDAVKVAIANLPADRQLRVLEVGAGTGATTARLLSELPTDRFNYTFTDISASFFPAAEKRFAAYEGAMDYRVLNLEKDALTQDFVAHSYDLIIAANVLHATKNLGDSLANCHQLLSPAGQLIALENVVPSSWSDITFGLLDGWWRFDDAYRSQHALASPQVWRQALADAGYGAVEVLGDGRAEGDLDVGRAVIIAQGQTEVSAARGLWVLVAERSGVAAQLAAALRQANQEVLISGEEMPIDMHKREAWQVLWQQLPDDVPLAGVVYLAGLDGHGVQASSAEMAQDIEQMAGGALAMLQGLIDAEVEPSHGVWLVTRGAQVLERERLGELAGATLWGIGKVAMREAAHLKPRLIDLDPASDQLPDNFIAELLFPEAENHIAYRAGTRKIARLVRDGAQTQRLTLPQDSAWQLLPSDDDTSEKLRVMPLPRTKLGKGQVRIAVEAAGLNFHDVIVGMGWAGDTMHADSAEWMGVEASGRVLEVGAEVTDVAVGEQVFACAYRCSSFATEMVTWKGFVASATKSMPLAALATIPLVSATVAIAFDLAQLKAGERVLIHTGTGGVGQAAIQLAQAVGAEVYSTASSTKQEYLRALGVEHVFDSRQTQFGEAILAATGGKGVDVVLNTLTGEGFIEASLACLATNGRFVELSKLNIWSEQKMATVRPDVSYHVLGIDVVRYDDQERLASALADVRRRMAGGELRPLPYSVWPFTEAVPAMEFMRSARHVGKIVLTMPPLQGGQLKADRTYLVTGGLGGIGGAVAGWLADKGAGTIVLNGRRPPDAEVEKTIAALQQRGVRVQVEIADVSDADAVQAMLARIKATLLPLAGVIHSVGVLADALLPNQSWEKFAQVLRPKVLGAWHLHRATEDLDLFILFSSVAGVLGNAGQANHAAANIFLDQLAAHRRALGLAGQSIAWGAWSGLGEAEEHRARLEESLQERGRSWITPQQGIAVLDKVVQQCPTSSYVAAVDWQKHAEYTGRHEPLLEELLPAPELMSSSAVEQVVADNLLSQLRASPAAERASILVAFLQRELQAALHSPNLPSPTVNFRDMGMDSLMAVEMHKRINGAFAGEYTAHRTVMFNYTNCNALAQHLVTELAELCE